MGVVKAFKLHQPFRLLHFVLVKGQAAVLNRGHGGEMPEIQNRLILPAAPGQLRFN